MAGLPAIRADWTLPHVGGQLEPRGEAPPKPLRGKPRHFFERAGFFKKMRCGRNDLKSLFAAKFRKRLAVSFRHRFVPFADDQQRRRGHTSEHPLSHVGAAASADDCSDFFRVARPMR